MRRGAPGLALPLLLLGLLLLGACGGDDDERNGDAAATTATTAAGPADREAYVAALAGPLASGAAGVVLDAEVAGCVAGSIVDAVGVERLVDAGVAPGALGGAEDLASLGVELPAGAVPELGDGLQRCGIAAQIEVLLVAAYASDSGAGLSESATACVSDALDDAAVAVAVAEGFLDATSDGPFELVPAAVGACPDATVELLVNGFREVRELGPDEVTCMREFVLADAERAATAFSTDPAVADEFGAELIAACPSLGAG